MQPLVSTIMPAYNAEQYIEAAIESVLAQTYENWELMVVDDGSIDGTAEIVRRFAASDARIKYIYQANQMLARARNNGIRHSEGSLIAFLDSDDLWLPEKLELQVAAIEAERADLVFSDGWVFVDEDAADETQPYGARSGCFSGAEMFRLGFIENQIPVLSVLVRRDVLMRANCFDEDPCYRNCEDYDLWMRLADGGAVFYGMPDKLFRYRHRSGSMSRHSNIDPRFIPILYPENSQSLSAKIALLKKYQHTEVLPRWVMQRRFRNLYRELVAVALAESKTFEGQAYARESLLFEEKDYKTLLKQYLIRYAPRYYNPLRLHLFRAKILLKGK